jgi:uncharacterized membrane protein YphA (DoxX/SURF4 family)
MHWLALLITATLVTIALFWRFGFSFRMGCVIALLGVLVFWTAMWWGWNYDYEEGTILFNLQQLLAGVSLVLLIGGPLFFWLLLPIWRKARQKRMGKG